MWILCDLVANNFAVIKFHSYSTNGPSSTSRSEPSFFRFSDYSVRNRCCCGLGYCFFPRRYLYWPPAWLLIFVPVDNLSEFMVGFLRLVMYGVYEHPNPFDGKFGNFIKNIHNFDWYLSLPVSSCGLLSFHVGPHYHPNYMSAWLQISSNLCKRASRTSCNPSPKTRLVVKPLKLKSGTSCCN